MKAMPELLCDKVSRKLQKELGGNVCDAMWHLERRFFIGMPDCYFACAERLAKEMMEHKSNIQGRTDLSL